MKILVCLSLLTAGCSLPGQQTEWTVMSWNVQNLFDGIDDGNEYSEFDPDRGWSQRLYERRLDRCGEVIGQGRRDFPDLLVLQELEKVSVLDDLADGPLKNQGYDWRVAVPGFGLIRCGILSRYPVRNVSVTDCGQTDSRYQRPALALTVESPAGPVRVIALHWKSPWNGRAATEVIRRYEAAIVRDLAESWLNQNPGGELMIIGDLNTPGDGAVRPAALGPADRHPEDTILLRTADPGQAGLHGSRRVWYDPEPESEPPGTYWFDGQWTRPDRALLNRPLTEEPGLKLRRTTAAAPDVMGDAQGRPHRWMTSQEEGYSDHLPLLLEFSVHSQ